MVATHNQGPMVAFGVGSGVSPGSNPHAGPDIDYQGSCIIDVRWPYNPGQTGPIPTFLNSPFICMYDGTPAAANAANIVAAATATSGTAMTLAAGAGMVSTTYTAVASGMKGTQSNGPGPAPGGNIAYQASQTPNTAILAVNEVYAPLIVGQVNAIYDPTKSTARTLRVVSNNVGDTGWTMTITGYDVFGFPMSEAIAVTANGTANGKKAFKYIASAVPTKGGGGSSTGTFSVGTNDVFGFALKVANWEYTNIFFNGAFVTASTGYLTADTTSPATTTTGDVRGTYAVQAASDGTKRLTMYLTPTLSGLTGGTVKDPTPMFGVSQV